MLTVPNTVVCADHWFVFCITDLVEACDDWADEVRSKSNQVKLVSFDLRQFILLAVNCTYLFSYREVDTSLEKVEAFISRPSLSLYMFILNFMSELLQRGMSKRVYYDF